MNSSQVLSESGQSRLGTSARVALTVARGNSYLAQGTALAVLRKCCISDAYATLARTAIHKLALITGKHALDLVDDDAPVDAAPVQGHLVQQPRVACDRLGGLAHLRHHDYAAQRVRQAAVRCEAGAASSER